MNDLILNNKKLLIVDDESDLRDIVSSELEYMGAEVFQAGNIIAAQEILEKNMIDLVISDIRMPGGTGIDLLEIIKLKDVNIPPVILITGFADISIEEAFNKGAEALLSKPFKLDELIQMVVRYTSPFDSKFKEKVLDDINEPVLNINKIKFGRGGFSVEVSNFDPKLKIGEQVKFSFDYQNKIFQGVGICRWLHNKDSINHVSYMGLEFMNLPKSSIEIFSKVLENKKMIPYIPSTEV